MPVKPLSGMVGAARISRGLLAPPPEGLASFSSSVSFCGPQDSSVAAQLRTKESWLGGRAAQASDGHGWMEGEGEGEWWLHRALGRMPWSLSAHSG